MANVSLQSEGKDYIFASKLRIRPSVHTGVHQITSITPQMGMVRCEVSSQESFWSNTVRIIVTLADGVDLHLLVSNVGVNGISEILMVKALNSSLDKAGNIKTYKIACHDFSSRDSKDGNYIIDFMSGILLYLSKWMFINLASVSYN